MARKTTDDRASRPDKDNPEWTPENFAEARPAAEVLPGFIGEKATQELMRRSRGRPPKADMKVNQTLRLDPDVLEAFQVPIPDLGLVVRQDARRHEETADRDRAELRADIEPAPARCGEEGRSDERSGRQIGGVKTEGDQEDDANQGHDQMGQGEPGLAKADAAVDGRGFEQDDDRLLDRLR